MKIEGIHCSVYLPRYTILIPNHNNDENWWLAIPGYFWTSFEPKSVKTVDINS